MVRSENADFQAVHAHLDEHGTEARKGAEDIITSIAAEHREIRSSLRTLTETVKETTLLAAKTDREFRQAVWFAKGAFAVLTVSIGTISWVLLQKNAQLEDLTRVTNANQMAVVEAAATLRSVQVELKRQDDIDKEMLRILLSIVSPGNSRERR